jgi:hypothetical protein
LPARNSQQKKARSTKAAKELVQGLPNCGAESISESTENRLVKRPSHLPFCASRSGSPGGVLHSLFGFGCSPRGICVARIRHNSGDWMSKWQVTCSTDSPGSARRRMVGNVPADVHRVVQNPEDVSCAAVRNPIEDEMSSSSAVSSDMEGAQTRLDLVPSLAVGHKRICGHCAERVDERLAIDRCLLSSELLDGPLSEGHKVALGRLR